MALSRNNDEQKTTSKRSDASKTLNQISRVYKEQNYKHEDKNIGRRYEIDEPSGNTYHELLRPPPQTTQNSTQDHSSAYVPIYTKTEPEKPQDHSSAYVPTYTKAEPVKPPDHSSAYVPAYTKAEP
ncbi:unnamed protein product, partial [Cylicostephanus goldi]